MCTLAGRRFYYKSAKSTPPSLGSLQVLSKNAKPHCANRRSPTHYATPGSSHMTPAPPTHTTSLSPTDPNNHHFVKVRDRNHFSRPQHSSTLTPRLGLRLLLLRLQFLLLDFGAPRFVTRQHADEHQQMEQTEDPTWGGECCPAAKRNRAPNELAPSPNPSSSQLWSADTRPYISSNMTA